MHVNLNANAIMWVCIDCANGHCPWCRLEFDDLDDAIEHVRKEHGHVDIRRPGPAGILDSHGHQWYCFEYSTDFKDHRSYKSSEAMLHHLKDDCHRCGVVRADSIEDNSYWCSKCVH